MKRLKKIVIPDLGEYEGVIYWGIAISFILSVFCAVVWGADRGSGPSTQCVGSPCDQLYLPVAREEPGWLTGSTDSINNNFIVISSAINRIEVLGGNTNYVLITSTGNFIQDRNTLQSGSTFYVSSGAVSTQFIVGGGTLTALANGRVGISSSTPVNTLGVQGGGHFSSTITASNFFVSDGTQLLSTAAPVSGSTNYIQNTNSLQTGSTFYASSGTVNEQFQSLGVTLLGDGATDTLQIFGSS